MRTSAYQRYFGFHRSLFILIAGLSASTSQPPASTNAWYPSVLTNYTLPSWNPTNPIPLTPDKAVINAIKHANLKQAGSWRATRIRLQRYTPSSPWFYIVTLEGPSSMIVRVGSTPGNNGESSGACTRHHVKRGERPALICGEIDLR